jgi:hypothetical protein
LIETRKNKLNINYYFVKLRNISDTKELINNPIKIISTFVSDFYGIKFNRNSENLIILDGLDELYMKEALTSNDIDEFCREIGNHGELMPRTKFIVTSRYGYVDLERIKKNHFIVLSLSEFDYERQKEWVRKYQAFYPDSNLDKQKLEQINQNIPHVSELISQPILLHLISKINIDYNVLSNQAAIYNELFDTLIERKWEKESLDNLRGITPEILRRYIRDIALAIYQGDYEYIRKKDLEGLKATRNFLDKLKKANLKDSLKSIMISFYFQEVRRKITDTAEEDTNNYAIEFLHKSLQEYLVAEKIWEGFVELIDIRSNGEFFIDSWEQALEHINEILAPKIISKEIVEYLIEMIKNEKNIELKNKLRERLHSYFSDFLAVKFYNDTLKTPTPTENAINTFYGFWTIFSHLDIDQNYIQSQYKDIFVKLMKWSLADQHLYYNLSYQNLRHSNLDGINLKEVKLNESNLSDCSLNGANFEKANIIESNFKNAKLRRVNLLKANISNSDFSKAAFSMAYYQASQFLNCTFDKVLNINLTELRRCSKITNPKNLDPKLREALADIIIEDNSDNIE